MAARLETSDLPAIARNYGQAGRPMPDWVRKDPALVSAYDQGTGAAGHPPFHPPPDPSRAPAQPRPTSSSSSKPKGRPGWFSRSVSPTAAAAPVTRRLSAAGDGGGLLLVLVLYPVGLAILKNGAAGPGIWFRAKWLNETTSQTDNLPNGGDTFPPGGQTTDPNAPGYVNPKAKPGQPGSGKWPDGRPIPGQPQPVPPGHATV